jgi:uncharacterized cupin superfamily protein
MPRKLSQHPVHLGLGASAVVEPAFSGMDWYQDYSARHADDGREGRLVSMHAFDGPWDSWEMHPEGSELVVCTDGEMTLVQEVEGQEIRTNLRAGEYAINDAGVWHTADVREHATALFVTAGIGTQIRAR